jgi:hypothetical protein
MAKGAWVGGRIVREMARQSRRARFDEAIEVLLDRVVGAKPLKAVLCKLVHAHPAEGLEEPLHGRARSREGKRARE